MEGGKSGPNRENGIKMEIKLSAKKMILLKQDVGVGKRIKSKKTYIHTRKQIYYLYFVCSQGAHKRAALLKKIITHVLLCTFVTFTIELVG